MYNKKVFNRDGATRRGKERAALREKTGELTAPLAYLVRYLLIFRTLLRIIGLSDEQIEGWKIMLERNVRLSSCLLCVIDPDPLWCAAASSDGLNPSSVGHVHA